ncbi:MAG: PHP domain-containing protein, partial [Gammaproteobacteria bacterium]
MSTKSIPCQPAYAELHAVSNFTFLRGASHPEELVRAAHDLGYGALALTDECSLAAVVRAHTAAKRCGLKLIIGTELTMRDGMRLVLLATDRASYGKLSALITRGRRRATKGAYELARSDLEAGLDGCLAVLIPHSAREGKAPARRDFPAEARWLAEAFSGRAWVELHREGEDHAQLEALRKLGHQTGIPLLAAGAVHMHRRGRRALQDTLTAIRLGLSLEQAGFALHPNGERHLHSRAELAALYPAELMAETLAVAERCSFSLDELRYEYPQELVPAGRTPAAYLRELTEAGLYKRWPAGVPDKVRSQVEHELKLIAELGYEPYFLTVHDIVRFARSRNILCQGRGSAANSAVCFSLGITEVDPARMEILFERFVSKERNEPPDIDVDFEH